MSSFKQNHDFLSRFNESQRVLEKYPNRIPVICETQQTTNSSELHLKKTKYLVPETLTVGQFMYVLRKQMTLKPEEAIFLLVNNILIPTSTLMSQVYTDHKEEDGFVYFYCCKESVYG